MIKARVRLGTLITLLLRWAVGAFPWASPIFWLAHLARMLRWAKILVLWSLFRQSRVKRLSSLTLVARVLLPASLLSLPVSSSLFFPTPLPPTFLTVTTRH